MARAIKAEFDERLSLIGLLEDRVCAGIREVIRTEDYVTELLKVLKDVKAGALISDKIAETEMRMQQQLLKNSGRTDINTKTECGDSMFFCNTTCKIPGI